MLSCSQTVQEFTSRFLAVEDLWDQLVHVSGAPALDPSKLPIPRENKCQCRLHNMKGHHKQTDLYRMPVALSHVSLGVFSGPTRGH